MAYKKAYHVFSLPLPKSFKLQQLVLKTSGLSSVNTLQDEKFEIKPEEVSTPVIINILVDFITEKKKNCKIDLF